MHRCHDPLPYRKGETPSGLIDILFISLAKYMENVVFMSVNIHGKGDSTATYERFEEVTGKKCFFVMLNVNMFIFATWLDMVGVGDKSTKHSCAFFSRTRSYSFCPIREI